MKKIAVYQTFDGKLHDLASDADTYLDKLEGELYTKLAIELTKCDGKYKNFLTVLESENTIKAFEQLLKIRADFNIDNSDFEY
jgi:hypothetical protein